MEFLKRAACAVVLLAALCVEPSQADAGWYESGDAGLRMDLQLLNDAEVIRLPVNTWPLPSAAVAHAMSNAKIHFLLNNAVKTAFDRVRARVDRAAGFRFEAAASAGDPAVLRDFDPLAREKGELAANIAYSAGRIAASVRMTGVGDPADDESLRLDGSHATVQLGNWLVSAHTLDRFWGPSHESSLILSNNARPMPTLMIERAEVRPFASRWLAWLGPWSTTFGVSRMESDRQDIDSPLFMAWRVVVMPLRGVELGFSRTAQFCGDQLECNLDVFGNLLAGNDNVGIDATPENEPGNQMAGFDMRWSSPIGNLPYAIYGQYIGEDESSYMPVKFLSQIGADVWRPLVDGGVVQVFVEYSSTTCSANSSSGPYYNCAYNQGRFNVEGYRYRNRVIGHTADSDAEMYAAGAIFNAANGEVWSAIARTGVLNRDDTDVRNTVSSIRARYDAAEIGWRGSVFGERIAIDVGAQSIESRALDREIDVYATVRWTHEFLP